MEVKKFKNGNINLYTSKNDFEFFHETNYALWYDELTNNDLYLQVINGYLYLLDTSSDRLLELPNNYYGYTSTLQAMKELCKIDTTVKLYAMNKKANKDLLQDLENGY